MKDLSCEIQICSMMSHVWNEIEHDIAYKPIGSVGNEEKKLLAALGELVRLGDEQIENLFEANANRIAHDDRIIDPSHLIDLLQNIFDIRRVTFRDSIGDLFEILGQLRLTTTTALRGALGLMPESGDMANAKKLWEKAQGEIRRFNSFLDSAKQEQYKMAETNSSDPALFIILQNQYKEILISFPAGRGMGRPSRIRSLATRYKEFIERR